MPDPAPLPTHRPGRLGWIALPPGMRIGCCLGAWQLAIALEWPGEAFFIVPIWPPHRPLTLVWQRG